MGMISVLVALEEMVMGVKVVTGLDRMTLKSSMN